MVQALQKTSQKLLKKKKNNRKSNIGEQSIRIAFMKLEVSGTFLLLETCAVKTEHTYE